MKVLGVSGSLRADSHNTLLLRGAAEHLPDEAWSSRCGTACGTSPRTTRTTTSSRRRRRSPRSARAIAGADALLFATPEYNSSIPGQLKNALDWASRPLATNVLRNKPVAVVGASTGAFGAVWAQAELRKVLGAAGARVVDGEVAVGHAHRNMDGDGGLPDDEVREQPRGGPEPTSPAAAITPAQGRPRSPTLTPAV